MTGAVFRQAEFRGFDLDAVSLPDEPALHVIHDFPCVARSALQALAARPAQPWDTALRRWLEAQLDGIDFGHPASLLNRHDFERWGGDELAKAAEPLIRQAESDCRRCTSWLSASSY